MSLLKPELDSVHVPEWVRFIAQDSDGSWWGYSVEPLQNHRGWYENELGQNKKLIETKVCDDWRESLYKY